MTIFGFIRSKFGKKRDLADFLLNASSEEKMRVFRIAAEKSNKDQRQLLKSVGSNLCSGQKGT